MKQHTMLRNQLRSLMAEFGIVAAKGQRGLGALIEILVDPEERHIPSPLREGLVAIVETLRGIDRKLEAIDRQLVQAGRASATYRHLITAPGYGPILASAVVDPGAFRRGDDFAASLGLVPRQEGTGGKTWLGPISKRGNGYLRRRLVNGATAVLKSKRSKEEPWLRQAARHQAAQAGGDRLGQQNGAHRLGADDPSRGLPRPAGGGVKPPATQVRKACQGEHA